MNNEILAMISTKGRDNTTLGMAILSVLLQTKKPNKLVIFDDNLVTSDPRTNPLFEHLFRLADEKGIEWFWAFGQKKGQHFNHQTANKMGYKYVWRVDDDEFAEEHTLETLYSLMKDDVGAVGGLVLVPYKAMELMPEGTDNSIKNFYSHPNLQWFRDAKAREVEHLTSSFLYRAGIVDYNLNLSMVAHTEETQFTYSLFKKGYKILFTPDCTTWHFRQPTGGIRQDSYSEMWTHDEDLFTVWLANQDKQVAYLNNGLGDHIVFKSIIPEIKNKDMIIACCFPEVFEDVDGVETVSLERGKKLITNTEKFDVYRFMWDNNWTGSLQDAFREVYK